jgi:trehalose-6-phosphatase
VPAVIATTTAARIFGGNGGRFPRDSEQTHDIHLSAVYLHYRQAKPKLAASWASEARIYETRDDKDQKLPDAMITVADSPRVVEFGGAYSKAKLEAFHGYCSVLELPYEVW